MKIIIIGFGHLGAFFYEKLVGRDDVQIAGIYNRTKSKIPSSVLAFEDMNKLLEFLACSDVDLLIEVAHPALLQEFGARLIQFAPILVGSPIAFADKTAEATLLAAAKHPFFIPCGALWGSLDIQRLDAANKITALCITMKKHPHSIKAVGRLAEQVAALDVSVPGEVTVFEGSVRDLCPQAPNNVNTMAAAALACSRNLGFDRVQARLVADPALLEHVIVIELKGENGFSVELTRRNPAPIGVVTGQNTFVSFYASFVAIASQFPLHAPFSSNILFC